MDRVSIYVNTLGRTEEQFAFYGSVFGTEPYGLLRMSDIPPRPGQPALPADEWDAVMHIEVAILGGTVLMGTDMLRSMGHQIAIGNNMSINLEPDSLPEAERIFAALAEGGTDVVPLSPMFWGDYWGTCVDRFGIRWMVNCHTPSA